MKKYPFCAFGIDEYIYAVHDSAWRLHFNHQDKYPFIQSYPEAPLRWWIYTGRASGVQISTLLAIRPDVIARLCLQGGSDQEIVDRIRTRINQRMEVNT